MAAKNDSSIRAQVRKTIENGINTDSMVFEKPAVRRPPTSLKDIRADWAEVMENLAREGRGVTSFMVHLDVSRWALDNLLRDEPEFRRHYQKCLVIQKEYLEMAGLGMVNGKPGNAKVWSMFMVNVGDWKSENSRQEIVGDEKSPLVVKQSLLDAATEDELKAYADDC